MGSRRGSPVVLLLTCSVFGQPPQGERRVEGDMSFRPDSAFTGFTPLRLWTNNTVPYVLDPDIPNSSRVTAGFDYYNQNTPVKFQPRGSEANYVHLVRSTVGNGVCSSNVGMIGGEQFIHVEDACTTSSLIHEMGHTVGFLHEQSRSDRNRYVTVLYENIDKTGWSDSPVNGPPIEQDIGPYDYASHMHYGAFGFSVNNQPAIQTVPAGIPLDPYTVLSPEDLDTLFRMYGQPPARTTVVTNPPGLQMTIDGQTVTSPQLFNWPAGSVHTLEAADQTGPASRYVFGRWSDGGTASHMITADPSVTLYSANFVQQVKVTVVTAASGGGTAALDAISPDNYFASQTVLQMSAQPSPGYTFLNWSGSTCPRLNAASPTVIVAASTDISCTATFTQSPVTTILTSPRDLPVTVDGLRYVQTPINFAWTPGSTHMIATAAPASNPVSPVRYTFGGWSDGGAASHSIAAAPGTITATYLTEYSVVVPASVPGVAAFNLSPSTSDRFYAAGTQVQVTAVPAAGWKFSQWTLDLAGQPNPGVLTMNSQMAFSAILYQNPPPLVIANSASFANASISPGEIVTIFGNGIGPANAAGLQLDGNGNLATTVANTSVLFNRVPAPIISASANQTSVVVPYELAGQSAATIQVQYNGVVTAGNSAVDVSAPGLFTANTQGRATVAATNQDGSSHTPGNAAVRGSVVTFYATGAGQLSPGGADGAVIGTPLPTLTQPVSLRIGGKPAQLLYAGPAPGEVSGVLQINAVVPPDAPIGDAVSVYLVIGNNSSPPGVTMAVR